MKIAVFTYDRIATATTPKVLEAAGLDYMVVCHGPERAAEYVARGTVKAGRIVSSGVPPGLANNRNWYVDHVLGDGEWCLMLVDDWIQAYEFRDYDASVAAGVLPITLKNVSSYNALFKHPISMQAFCARAEELRMELEQRKIDLGGWASYENPLFRAKRLRTNVFADGRAWVMRKTLMRFDPNVKTIEDYGFSAQNIYCGSGTLVDNWIAPTCQRYTAGGYGTKDDRMAQKIRDCAYLVRTYPGLVRYAKKPGWPAGSHVKIAPWKPARTEAERVRARSAAS